MLRNTWPQRVGAYLAIVALAIASISLPVQAATVTTASLAFTAETYQAGGHIEIDSRTKIDIFRNALANPGNVTLSKILVNAPAVPKNTKAFGSMYRLKTTSHTAWAAAAGSLPAYITLPAESSQWDRRIWMYDPGTQKWKVLTTKVYDGRKIAIARPTNPNAIYAVLEDRRIQRGIASWYCKLHCSSRYPTLHGTSNDFPVGSYVTVKSLETKGSVRVKIVSRWGQPAGRVIDLSYAAFEKIRGVNGGLARVEVTSIPTVAVTTTTTTTPSVVQTTLPTPSADPAPKLTVTKKDATPYPGSSIAAYTVFDEGSGTVLAEKMSTTVRSIASITKLMTAAVAIDEKIDMKKWLIYSSSDLTPYAYLQVKPGEVLSNQDLFYSLLVGSANNAATALARSTGLSRAAFVAKMNAKAKALGATQTTFVDTHGLDPRNTSTTNDLARLASKIFSSYPLIRQATEQKSYDFTTRNTKVKHHIVTTDKLLLNGPMPTGMGFAGAKTGFIDEAGYTYVVRFSAPNGARIVVALLGAPSAAVRYSDAAALARWAWNQYTWSG